ncbi:MAG: ATPase [Silicimonas sp.]|nr:ATPase [Silicimonas sp.]
MTQLAETSILAIDGGGTRCRIALVGDQNHVQIEAGSANVSTDFSGAVAMITKGLGALAAKAGTTADALYKVPTYMSLAGIKGPALPAKLETVLPFAHLRAEEDRVAAVRGALGDSPGAVIHCGTGSFFANQTPQQSRFAGGWGPVLGDVGSAMWMGRSALSATLDAEDGLRAQSPMSQAMLDRFGDASGIVAFAATATPADFGALAPAIMPFAKSSDTIVLDLMADLATTFATTLDQLGWTGDTPVALTGGIAPSYAPYLPDHIKDRLADPLGTPMDGAIALARQFAAEVRP